MKNCAAASRPSQTPFLTACPRPVTMRSMASIISGGSTANSRW